MKVEIVKFDNCGRGIGYLNDKIIFVPKTVPGDIVVVEVKCEKKNYIEGILKEVIVPSKKRIAEKCPYFSKCGGCDLLNISLSEALEYKLNKVNEILRKNKIDYNVIDIVKNDREYNYRNKISLKVKDSKIGFFESETHSLVQIDYCYLSKTSINEILKDLEELNIQNGDITIRSNYNNEVILNINTQDEITNIKELIEKYKVVGIIKNKKCIYGEDYFIDKISNYLFKVSYDAFFQINPYISSKLFSLVDEFTKNSINVIDLYCGVGTLSIVASKNAKKVLGVEIVENAIKDANFNKNLNNQKNIEFICDDTSNIINQITSEYDTIILDPPRSGVSKKVIDKIVESKIHKIIYVSCNPLTLVRDLKLLLDYYNIVEFKLLDMFVNSEHVESFVVFDRA